MPSGRWTEPRRTEPDLVSIPDSVRSDSPSQSEGLGFTKRDGALRESSFQGTEQARLLLLVLLPLQEREVLERERVSSRWDAQPRGTPRCFALAGICFDTVS